MGWLCVRDTKDTRETRKRISRQEKWDFFRSFHVSPPSKIFTLDRSRTTCIWFHAHTHAYIYIFIKFVAVLCVPVRRNDNDSYVGRIVLILLRSAWWGWSIYFWSCGGVDFPARSYDTDDSRSHEWPLLCVTFWDAFSTPWYIYIYISIGSPPHKWSW